MIVKIFQGPGNQMFQYAYGLAAAKRMNASFKLDTTWYNENSQHRAYILNGFNIKTPIATPQEIEYVRRSDGRNFLEYWFKQLKFKLSPRHKKANVKEDLSIFDHKLKWPAMQSYVEGYFTSEDFFQDNETEVREAFQFVNQLSVEATEIANGIDENTVALSIRRGDFIGNALHNVCSKEYFYRAVEEITRYLKEPRLLIFSDDIDWVRENMRFAQESQFVPAFTDSMEHMRLMSLCKYHIIPNSTFSWWGAWLSRPKKVIAPDIWLTQDEQVHETTFGHWVETGHTVPENWLRLPARLKGESIMN